MTKDMLKQGMKLLSEYKIVGALELLEKLEVELVPLTREDDYRLPESGKFVDFYDLIKRYNELRDGLLEDRRNLVDE